MPVATELSISFFRYRLHFQTIDPLYFPPGKAGNILRGAFGTIFRKIACLPSCPDVPHCEMRRDCAYAKVFEPQALSEEGPSGYQDWPRPFVLRAAHLGSRRLDRGERFFFDFHLFNTNDSLLPYFVLTFSRLVEEGVGPRRSRAKLLSVEQLPLTGDTGASVFDGATFRILQTQPALSISLAPPSAPVCRVEVLFITPTELKSGRDSSARPEFHVLFARLRDRISNLRAFYGPGPLEIDFKAAAQRASTVRLTHCDIRHEEVTRRSSRTHETHTIGGFVGEAVYEGDLAEFLPYLQAGLWTGVGKHTVWGNGEIRIHNLYPVTSERC